jgi:uncharacterized protein YjiS (DUF1127 family)
MSATVVTTVRPAVTKRAGAFARRFSAWSDGIARYLLRRAAVASLRDLDDRVLRDIGLEPSEIEAAVNSLIALSYRARLR